MKFDRYDIGWTSLPTIHTVSGIAPYLMVECRECKTIVYQLGEYSVKNIADVIAAMVRHEELWHTDNSVN